jgi:hypothetical protein
MSTIKNRHVSLVYVISNDKQMACHMIEIIDNNKYNTITPVKLKSINCCLWIERGNYFKGDNEKPINVSYISIIIWFLIPAYLFMILQTFDYWPIQFNIIL